MKRIVPLIAPLTALGFLLAGCTETMVFSHLLKRQQEAGGCSTEGAPKIGEPYTVDGIRYSPSASSMGYREKGIASWYGDDFHGKATANGECYNMYAYTAAHKTLPLPTVVRVTNLENNKSIVVKVNDRGPFVRGRLIDLSYAAAQSLDIVRMGSAPVLVEAIDGPFNGPKPDVMLAAKGGGTGPTLAATATPGTTEEENLPAPASPLDNVVAGIPPAKAQAMQAEVPPPAAPATLPPMPTGGPVAATAPLVNTHVFVQVGAFGELPRANLALEDLRRIESTAFTMQTATSAGQSLTRVRSGPYASIADAQEALNKVAQAFPMAKIVVEK